MAVRTRRLASNREWRQGGITHEETFETSLTPAVISPCANGRIAVHGLLELAPVIPGFDRPDDDALGIVMHRGLERPHQFPTEWFHRGNAEVAHR